MPPGLSEGCDASVGQSAGVELVNRLSAAR